MIDKLVKKGDERENIIVFDKAMKLDMSTNGRVNYTDELIIVMVEMAAYLIRGLRQLRDLPWDDKLRESYSYILRGDRGRSEASSESDDGPGRSAAHRFIRKGEGIDCRYRRCLR